MGAIDFQSDISKNDAADISGAFLVAKALAKVELERDWDGEDEPFDGYDGTILTVRDFREFDKPESLSDNEFIDVVWSANAYHSYGQYEADNSVYGRLTRSEKDLVNHAASSIQKWECCIGFKSDNGWTFFGTAAI